MATDLSLSPFDVLGQVPPRPLRDPHLLAAYRDLAHRESWDREVLAEHSAFAWRAFGAFLAGHRPAAGEGPRLLAALADPHPFVRTCAAWSLGEREGLDPGPSESRGALVAAVLQDEAWQVGRKAALALGKREGPAAVLAFWREVRDRPLHAWVRRGLVQAAGVPDWPAERMAAWLAEAGPEDREALAFLLKDRPWAKGVEDLVRDLAAGDPWIAHLVGLSRKLT